MTSFLVIIERQIVTTGHIVECLVPSAASIWFEIWESCIRVKKFRFFLEKISIFSGKNFRITFFSHLLQNVRFDFVTGLYRSIFKKNEVTSGQTSVRE